MLDILSQVKVLDLTTNVAGPFCTLILADLGASVWKVEGPEGDVVRRWPPFAADGTSTAFVALNRGKQSVQLDLKQPAGRMAFLRLARAADVMVSSVRPGGLDRLGLDRATLAAQNPGLIVADISAYGGRGERGGRPGYDAVIQAYTGLMDLTGYPGQPPARVGTGLVDMGTGMWAALGIVSSLLNRERDGQGADVHATLFGTAVGFLVHHLAAVELAGAAPTRIGTAQHNTAPYEAFACSDGMVMVGVTSQGLWRVFCQAVGAPELADHPDYCSNDARVLARAKLHEVLESRSRSLSCAEFAARLEAAGVPCSPIRTVADLAADPVLDQAGLWQLTEHGGNAAAVPLYLGDQAPAIGSRAPALGMHTSQVLAEAGAADGEIEELTAPTDRQEP
ncbi:MAG TPA: CoA transferase [Streptosporangiaceae bacterium]|jgi:crotonobetainyl-CoA:carnitine CoA-transferase CaiB-like acyl-CoA transferase